jgi:hypothetical protein
MGLAKDDDQQLQKSLTWLNDSASGKVKQVLQVRVGFD